MISMGGTPLAQVTHVWIYKAAPNNTKVGGGMERTRIAFSMISVMAIAGVSAAEDYEPKPVAVIQDVENRGVLFDASGTQNLFPAPRSPRNFKSWNEFFEFLQGELFGTPFYEEGQLAGVTVAASLVGEAYRNTGEGEVLRVGCDPVGEYLVGEFGYFIVNGEKVFVERQPCWEWAAEYLASRPTRFRLAGAGGGCSRGGYCVANATWQGGLIAIHQAWGGTAFQSRSQVICKRHPFISWMMTCTSIPTNQNSLMSRIDLTGSVGNFIVDSKSKSGSNTQRVDTEFVEWKLPWAGGGLVFNSAGICGATDGMTFSSTIEAAAASSFEARSQFVSVVPASCRR